MRKKKKNIFGSQLSSSSAISKSCKIPMKISIFASILFFYLFYFLLLLLLFSLSSSSSVATVSTPSPPPPPLSPSYVYNRKHRQFFPSCSSHHQVEEDEAWERREKGNKEPRWQWSSSSAHVIAQLAKYMFYEPVAVATAMVGTRSWIGGLFTRSNRRQDKSVDYTLSPLQEERLQRLQDRMVVNFDETRPDHQESLKALWNVAYPNVSLTGLVTEQWKEMGWQGPNPSTDFRGCGFIALENLLFSARTYPVCFRRLLFKQRGDRAKWEYPFAVAGINISFMLIQMLDLQNTPKPKCLPGMNFLKLLEEDEKAFDVLYCIAFAMMDAQWLAMHASYMEFNEVLQATRNQLERELSLDDIHRIQDLPAYNLLFQ